MEEVKNIHWNLMLSDDYRIMSIITVDAPTIGSFTMSEASVLNKLLDSETHPVFNSEMDKNALNEKLQEFRKSLINKMKSL